ncbi:ABC transporter permease subunit [Actinopolymorpha rutila]|uniref:ABC-type transport system involved in multi-copper enzyme maturation permease subunit n=1 Tax=Actinopolymorpha rutila TaxID=446787 RepID=A0A852ZDP9_9ACTN|nr:ABC transporter permease subunit [Actinopolymorpha rutila]NYH91291.1 ABC-type transport system involved in multi-copper enzyme maturation permease subunit [Actinopolymorpha rutila]
MRADLTADLTADLIVVRKRPTFWILLAAWLVLDLVFAYLLPVVGYVSGKGRPSAGLATAEIALRSALPDQLVPNALGGMAVFGGAIAVVFGALLVGSDYLGGTLKAALLRGNGRTSVTTGRLAAIALVALFGVLATMGAGAASSVVVALSTDRVVHWPSAGQLVLGVLGGWLVMGMWSMFGAFLAHVVRGVALPIGLGVVWVMAVENLITNVLADLVSWLRPVRDLMPAANSGALIHAISAKIDLGEPAPGVNSLVGGTHAATTLLCYVAVCVVGSILLVRARDLQ